MSVTGYTDTEVARSMSDLADWTPSEAPEFRPIASFIENDDGTFTVRARFALADDLAIHTFAIDVPGRHARVYEAAVEAQRWLREEHGWESYAHAGSVGWAQFVYLREVVS